MIVRNRPSAFQLFFIMRGSIVPRIKWQVLCTVGVAVLVTMAHGTLFNQKVTLTPIPFSSDRLGACHLPRVPQHRQL